MNQQRVDRVLARLGEKGLEQALICDPLSIWYLSGYYTEPYERFFALYLGRCDGQECAVLFCNRLFCLYSIGFFGNFGFRLNLFFA